MPRAFEPKLAHLPPAQLQIWPQLAPAPDLSFVLYGGTAVALQLGHRASIDFDFFSSKPLDKPGLATRFAFMPAARTIQEEREHARHRGNHATRAGAGLLFRRHRHRAHQ